MLQVARLSPKLLGESTALILDFLRHQQRGGGFADRSGNPDIYYTVFGLECLRALSADLPPDTAAYLLRADTPDLDFVHTCSLIRCWANLDRRVSKATELAERVERFRSPDGGYAGTLYGSFLAMGAYQDLQLAIPRPDDLIAFVHRMRSADGGFSNQAGSPVGQTSSTAAAVALLRALHQPVAAALAPWLLAQRHAASGGFFAAPAAPIPDLLSTATALHALVSMKQSIATLREPALDFIDTLWTTRGGFLGSWADDILDCEYTYYGLLSLGYLSLE
jgi:prenyltransferase beta subunit